MLVEREGGRETTKRLADLIWFQFPLSLSLSGGKHVWQLSSLSIFDLLVCSWIVKHINTRGGGSECLRKPTCTHIAMLLNAYNPSLAHIDLDHYSVTQSLRVQQTKMRKQYRFLSTLILRMRARWKQATQTNKLSIIHLLTSQSKERGKQTQS